MPNQRLTYAIFAEKYDNNIISIQSQWEYMIVKLPVQLKKLTMKKLSKDYLLVIFATFAGTLIALAFIHLPEWIYNLKFWQIICYGLMALIAFILTSMYINAGKLSLSFRDNKKQ